jgi:MOSC domain-containing protein
MDGMPMFVDALWRYPVKSLAGERLAAAAIDSAGIAGDRIVRVRGPEGVRTSRRHYRLLGLRGTLDADGQARINGYPWDSRDALALVKAAAGADAWLEACETLDRFDILPLLVATDGAVAAFGRDVRRLRPNIVIGGVDALAEREWVDGQLLIGDAVLRLDSLRSRCHMITIDPDSLCVTAEVLRDVVHRFDNKLCLNAEVVHAGPIRLGDPAVIVVPGAETAERSHQAT